MRRVRRAAARLRLRDLRHPPYPEDAGGLAAPGGAQSSTAVGRPAHRATRAARTLQRMASPLPDRALSLAERQHGVLARVQLLDHVSEGAVEGLVARRTLVPVERGVYRVAGSAAPPEQRAMAAVLRARPRARLTGPFVLGLHDVDGFTAAHPFLVLTAPGRRLTGVRFPHRPISTWETSARSGALPTVALPAAIIEAAHPQWNLPPRTLRVAVDHVRWRNGVSTAALAASIESAAGHEGARRLVALLGETDLVAESDGERRLGALLEGIEPTPLRQAWIDDRYRLDLYWPRLGLAVEYDGAVDHASRSARTRDRVRDRYLADRGIRTVRITAADLAHPEAVRRRLLEELLARAMDRDWTNAPTTEVPRDLDGRNR